MTSPQATYALVHELDPTCRYETTDDPLKAIGYHASAVREMVAGAGLEVRSIEHGSWAGDGAGPKFQDLVVIEKPAPTTQGRFRRAFQRDARAAG